MLDTPAVPPPSPTPSSPSDKAITSFSVGSAVGVLWDDSSVTVSLAPGTAVNALVATFQTTGVSVKVGGTVQVNGVTENDFTHPVVYTVTAADGSTQDWIVTVSVHIPTWNSVGSPWFSPSQAWFPSLALDNQGTPYVAFMDLGSQAGGRISVMRFDSTMQTGTGWRFVGSPGISDGGVPSLAFDASGVPFVGFTTDPNQQSRVLKFDGSQWNPVGSNDFSAHGSFAMAFAPSGSLYIAFDDDTLGRKASVMKLVGDSWVTVGQPGFNGGTIVTSISLAIDPQGTPYIAYNDLTYAGGVIGATITQRASVVMKLVGNTWSQVGPTLPIGFSISGRSLAFDGSGTPYIAIQEVGGKAAVRTFDGTDWTTVGGPGLYQGNATGIALTASPTGVLYVLYADDGLGGRATVMRLEAGAWVGVGMPGLSSGQAWWPSLALDASGRPFVAYGDGNNSKSAVVVAFE